MSPERMEHLLSLVAPLIQKRDTNFRKSIPPAERLMVTLRFLASGDSQRSLTYLFRMGKKTVSRIISETTCAMVHVLSKTYMSCPSNETQWKKISEEFEQIWNFPHVVGAIDGKHIQIEAPPKTGTLYHNYKGFFSLVLMAICDAKYNFVCVDVGQYGSNNDSGVLANSRMGIRFDQEKMKLPADEKIEGIDEPDKFPYFLLGDEIFPLKHWLMRPYPGKLPEEERIYNYRHSRARRTIENAFGILVARWRLFHRPIKASIQNTESYVMACLCLHNYLRQTENSLYTPKGFIDIEYANGDIKPGEWRNQTQNGSGCLKNLNFAKGGRRTDAANKMRESLKSYVSSESGSVPWQLEYVRSCGKEKS